jgi:hypothetical protein
MKNIWYKVRANGNSYYECFTQQESGLWLNTSSINSNGNISQCYPTPMTSEKEVAQMMESWYMDEGSKDTTITKIDENDKELIIVRI